MLHCCGSGAIYRACSSRANISVQLPQPGYVDLGIVLNQIETAMSDKPAHDPDSHIGDVEDAFADNLAGNVYAKPRVGSRHGLSGIAQTQLLNLAESGKIELVRNIAGIVGLVHTIAAQVEGFGVEPYANYARQAASLVDGLHDSIAEKTIEALIDDGRMLVRQQPEIAIAAAVITGFLAARLLKARS